MYKVERLETDHTSFLQEAMIGFSNSEPDIFIVSKEGYKIYTQRSLLTLYSSSMSSLLSSVSCCTGTSISLPVSSIAINNLLRILFKGVALAYDEKDLASVHEAAELMGIKLGDFNIKMNNDDGKSSDQINILPLVQLLESSGNEDLESSDNEDVVMTEIHDQSLLLTESVDEEIDDLTAAANESMVIVNAEVLNDILGENKETLAEQVQVDLRVGELHLAEEIINSTVMANSETLNDVIDENTETLSEEVENIENGSVVDELHLAEEMIERIQMENVETLALVEEVERMGANIESLAEEVDDDQADDSLNMMDEEEIEQEADHAKNMVKEGDNSTDILTEKSQNILKTLPDTAITKEKQSLGKMEGSSKNEKILEKQLMGDKLLGDGKSKCDICHKYFKRAQGLQRHKEKFHKEEVKAISNLIILPEIKSEVTEIPVEKNKVLVPETSSIIACKYCGKVFRSATSNYPLIVAKANLQRHLEKHERDNHKGKNITASQSEDDKDSSKRKDTSPPLNAEPLSKLAKTPVTAVIPPTVRELPIPKDSEEHAAKLNPKEGEKGLQKYSCKQCSKSFSTKEMYGMHQKIHLCQEKAQSQKKFTCEKCGKCFLFKDKLEKHMLFHNPKPVESQQTAYKCDICGKSFAKMDRLHLHRSYHTTFEQQNLLSGAKNNVNAPKNIISKFVCDQCDEEFDASQKLKEHKLKLHPLVKREILSPISTKHQSKLPIGSKDKINKINKMLSQLVKKETVTQSFFTCEKCSESFPSMEVLETHRQTSHETHECNGCDKTFETENELMEHIVVHINESKGGNGEDSSSHSMELSSSDDNMEILQGGSKYLCTMCGLEFEDENELFAHSSIHNVNEENEKYPHCDICDMDFESENAFKNHNRAHTEEMLLTVRMPVVDITKNNVLCFKF